MQASLWVTDSSQPFATVYLVTQPGHLFRRVFRILGPAGFPPRGPSVSCPAACVSVRLSYRRRKGYVHSMRVPGLGQECLLLLSSRFLLHHLELGTTGMLVDRGPVAVSTESLCVGGLAASVLSSALMATPTAVSVLRALSFCLRPSHSSLICPVIP